jgi:hypothetical protein
MGIGSIGSTQSFWQQDQSFWQQSKQADNYLAASASVINAIGTAETKLGKGMATIANATALNRVDTQLTKEIQQILSGNSGQTSSGSTGLSSAANSSKPAPATGIGKAALTTSTSLKTLGILAGGVITISAGKNTTTYASTGSDTVGDLMNAINSDLVGNAAVTASLNPAGRLVITSKNTNDTITLGGIYAGNIGFGAGNNTFKPTQAASAAAAVNPAPAPSTPAQNTSSGSAKTAKSYTTLASEMTGAAASLLADSGAGGTLVNMLA